MRGRKRKLTLVYWLKTPADGTDAGWHEVTAEAYLQAAEAGHFRVLPWSFFVKGVQGKVETRFG